VADTDVAVVSNPGPIPANACCARPTSWKSAIDRDGGLDVGSSLGAGDATFFPVVHAAAAASMRTGTRARFIRTGKYLPAPAMR
jgi:hypothetical protein